MNTKASLTSNATIETASSVNLLRGVPTYELQKNDTAGAFLGVDSASHSRLLEYFAQRLREGNLEPSEAQKVLIRKLQVRKMPHGSLCQARMTG